MADVRAELHEETDRLVTRDLAGLKEFLSTHPDRLCAAMRNFLRTRSP